jgi:ADP-heptose:LPS heptosyltransferase
MLNKNGMKTLLLGGPNETEKNERIASRCSFIIDSGTDNALENFSALVARCNAMVSADTMAMHIATALDVPTVTLFGPMNSHEIEAYNGTKIQSALECSPCFNHTCKYDGKCMKMITPESVYASVKELVS